MLHLEKNSAAGATFAFYLPLARSRGLHDSLQPNDDGPERHQPRILVMDDEAAIRDLTSQFFVRSNSAGRLGSGADLRTRAAQRRGFRGGDLEATIRGGIGGGETIERLRDVDPQVNAIICSGYSDAAAISRFLTYGFRSALSKPFTRRELADALQKALAGEQQN